MAQPPPQPQQLQGQQSETSIRAIFMQLPSLVEQARQGKLHPSHAVPLRNMIARQRNEIGNFFRSLNRPNPLDNLPPILDPAMPLPAPPTVAPSSVASPPGTPARSSPIPNMAVNPNVIASPRPPAIPLNPGQQGPMNPAQIQQLLQQMLSWTPQQRADWFKKVPGMEQMYNRMMESARMAQSQLNKQQTAAQVAGSLNRSASPAVMIPTNVAAPGPSVAMAQPAAVPPQQVASTGTASPAAILAPQPNPLPNLALPPGAIRSQVPAPGTTPTPPNVSQPVNQPSPQVPVIQTVQPVPPRPSAAAAAAATPAPPSATSSRPSTAGAQQQASPAPSASAPTPTPTQQPAVRPNQPTPQAVSTQPPARPPTHSTGPPVSNGNETAPPLTKDRVAYYMNLSDDQAKTLPPLQHRQWIWVKQAVRDQQMKAAQQQQQQRLQAQQAAAANKPGSADTKSVASTPSAAGQAKNGKSAPPPPPQTQAAQNRPAAAVNSKYQNLTLAQLLEMYAKTGQPITDEVRRQLSHIAIDGVKAGGGGGGGGGLPAHPVTPPSPPKTHRQIAEENMQKMIEGINGGGDLDPAIRGMLVNLHESLVIDAIDGAARIARGRNKGRVELTPQDMVTYLSNTHGVYVPGFGFEPPKPVTLRPGLNANGREVRLSAKRQRLLRDVYKARLTKAEGADDSDVEMR